MGISLKQEQSMEIKSEIDFVDTQIANLERRLKEARSKRAKLWQRYYEINPSKSSKNKNRKLAKIQGITEDDILEIALNRG